ncbi:hypothetical protein [Streptomyces mexicanus]
MNAGPDTSDVSYGRIARVAVPMALSTALGTASPYRPPRCWPVQWWAP